MSPLTERTHIPLLHVVKPRKEKKPIGKVSKKMSARLKLYAKARSEYLKDHPYCQWWIAEIGVDEQLVMCGFVMDIDSEYYGVKVPLATEIHHKRGRLGKLLYDKTYFMAVSRQGHEWIHANTRESYARGYMLKR